MAIKSRIRQKAGIALPTARLSNPLKGYTPYICDESD